MAAVTIAGPNGRLGVGKERYAQYSDNEMDDDNSLISADVGELDRKLEPKYSIERQLPLQPPEEG